MIWSIFLFAFLNYYSGVNSQPPWIQSTSLSVSPGQTVKLSCFVSGSVNTIAWYQQKSGQIPHYIHYSGGSRGDGIPDRFTASVSGSTGSLTITGTHVEDEADYYCAMWDSSANTWVFGGGTQLTVTGQPPVSPSVQVFAPSEEEIKTQKKATLVCLISGFHPAPFTLKWKVDDTDVTSGVETTKATKQGDKYLASSYLTRDEANYGDHTFVCEVTHDGKTFTKSISGSGSC